MHNISVDVESEENNLFYCNLYMDVRRRWKEKIAVEYAI